MNHECIDARIAKPPDIQGQVCIHVTCFSDVVCGKRIPRNRPNGWLCQYHAQAILKGEGVLECAQSNVT